MNARQILSPLEADFILAPPVGFSRLGTKLAPSVCGRGGESVCMVLRRISPCGFTFFEFMIVSLISTIIMVGSMMWLYSQTDPRLLESGKKALFEQHNLIITRIKKDLNRAVPVTGGMAYYKPNKPYYPGIQRITSDGAAAGPRNSSEAFDGVRMLTNDGIGFRLNIDAQAVQVDRQIIAKNPMREKLSQSPIPPLTAEEIFARNSFRLIKKLIQDPSGSNLIYTNNSQFSNVSRLAGAITNIASSLVVEDQEFIIPVEEMVANVEYAADVTSVAPLSAIEYVVIDDNNDGVGQLIRRQRKIDPDNQNPIVENSQEIIAENIREFKLDYAFANRRIDKIDADLNMDWPDAGTYYSHVRDPKYLAANTPNGAVPFEPWADNPVVSPGACSMGKCCTDERRCVHWGDVDSIQITLKLESSVTLRNPNLVASGGNISYQSPMGGSPKGSLFWTDATILFPAQYSLQGLVVESKGIDGSDNDCSTDIRNRCKSSCDKFTSEDPNAPNWKGYGNPDSFYCICAKANATQGNLTPPETLMGQTAIDAVLYSVALNDPGLPDESGFYTNTPSTASLGTNSANKRLLACLMHFDASKPEGAWLSAKHPLGALLANQCLDNPEIIRRKATPQEANNGQNPRWIYAFASDTHPSDTRGDGMAKLKQELEPPSVESSMGSYVASIRNYISCANFQVCDAPIQQVLARFGSNAFKKPDVYTATSISDFLPKPFRNSCGCLRVDPGVETANTDLSSTNSYLNYDYNLRCNLDLRPVNVTQASDPMAGTSQVVDFFARANNQTTIIDRPFCKETWKWSNDFRPQALFVNQVDPSEDRLRISGGHRFDTGMRVQLTSTSTLPNPLNATNIYYVRRLSTEWFTVHSAPATSNTNRVDINSSGSGTISVSLLDTNNMSKAYRVLGDGQSQALNDWQEALLCECYARRLEQNPWMSSVSAGINTYQPIEPLPTLNGLKGRGDLVDLRLPPIAQATSTFTFGPGDVDAEDNEIDINNFREPDGTAVTITSTGNLPGGLTAGTTYYIRHEDGDVSDDDIRFHTSWPATSSNRVNITNAGSGAHTLTIATPTTNVACGLTNSPSNTVEGINVFANTSPFSELWTTFGWASPNQALQGFSGNSWVNNTNIPTSSITSDARRLASGNVNASGIRVFYFDDKDNRSTTNSPVSALGYCSHSLCPAGPAGNSCRDNANQWYNDSGDDEDTDDDNNNEPVARRYPTFNRAAATQTPRLVPDYSSAIGPCTDPRNTFAARKARNEISSAESTEGYNAMLSLYNQNGTCGDLSSYCSPLCGRGLTDEQLVWTGITQVRNMIVQKYNGDLTPTSYSQFHPLVDARTSNHNMCGHRATTTLADRSVFLAQ